MINSIIQKALTGTGIEHYWIERPQNLVDCIVYNYNEFTKENADGFEESIKYDCYFNYICSVNNVANLRTNSEKIKEQLKINGFKKIDVLSPMIFELGGIKCYQVIFNYKKII